MQHANHAHATIYQQHAVTAGIFSSLNGDWFHVLYCNELQLIPPEERHKIHRKNKKIFKLYILNLTIKY